MKALILSASIPSMLFDIDAPMSNHVLDFVIAKFIIDMPHQLLNVITRRRRLSQGEYELRPLNRFQHRERPAAGPDP